MTARIVKWPGVELSAADLYEGKVTQTRYRPEAKYAWSAGEAMSRFLDELRAGRLIARTCHGCNRILFPPRMFCEDCFRPTDEWTYIRDTGTIETFSISYLDTDAKRIADPILVGVVSLDGASPKMGMMHYFGEMTKDEIRIGMRVRAAWKPPEERKGSVLDIRYFRPLREEER
ncbi:MAG TPA: Zn-ribbon domain-containing OB-fold protein [Thermoplasmata archaeon]|nr:Zn-ribbon domain-containing OB-fold protein [Thermoplasmata archaeon]